MEMQKLAFFRDAPAPWQATPPGGPVSLTAMTNVLYSPCMNGIGIIQKGIASTHKNLCECPVSSTPAQDWRA